MLLLEVITAEGADSKEGFLHLLIVVFSVAVAIAALALVIYTVAGLVKVCVEIVKPCHLSLCWKHREATGTQLVG